MPLPERIQVTWNAADGYSHFRAAGIEATIESGVFAEQIGEVLAAQQGRLFRLVGRAAGYATDLLLRVDAAKDNSVILTNCAEPPFTANYEVVPQPPPYVNHQGDYVFELAYAPSATE